MHGLAAVGLAGMQLSSAWHYMGVDRGVCCWRNVRSLPRPPPQHTEKITLPVPRTEQD
jgi:hypothetical protein